ncbi:MAG: hypothetical protein ABIA21_01495 [Candidatus Aenigmatarchaeota archaeon]
MLMRGEISNKDLIETLRVPMTSASRKKSFGSKGLLHTLEAIIAVSIILLALAFLLRGASYGSSDDGLYDEGFRALEYLDDYGSLRLHVIDNDVLSIKNDLKLVLYRDFDVLICGDCSMQNIASGRSVTAVEYYVSGDRDVYSPKKVVLYIWS